MAGEVCEHCQSPFSRDETITIREGFSYHKKCHKCYVCSETNLQNAEVFKGVIFCSSCAQRIFQGCSTARRTKTTHAGRAKRTRSRSHRRERLRMQDRRPDRSRHGVIEMAGMAGSTTDSDDHRTQKSMVISKPMLPVVIPTELALQATQSPNQEKCFYLQRPNELKTDSIEMGTTTDITQELLRQINCPVPECRATNHPPQTKSQPSRNTHKHHKRKEIIEICKPLCSDLRIAELGASTEIANMALRKKSEVPVIIKSNTRLKGRTSYSLSVLNKESVLFGNTSDWGDSAYSTIDESVKRSMMDRRLGSILKLPLQLFKKNILTKSSLINILMSPETDKHLSFMRRIKRLWYEEVAEHQCRGVKRLYSTINRRTIPYKLGWVSLVAKVSKDIAGRKLSACTYRCRHFKHSHSYRCMRAQVMKLAGPTKSELACYREKIKKIVAPQALRKLLHSNKNDYPAIKMSQACGSDGRSRKT